jgi:acetyl esterase
MKKRWWIPAVLLLTALGWWHFSTATPHGRLSARAALLIQIGALIGSDEDPDPAAFSDSVRQEIDKGTLMLAGPAPAFADIRDLALPGPSGAQPIRVYVPEGDSPKPVMVFFHGGGWTVGTLDHTDNLCRRLARSAGAVVVSVSYRLAPENPWPAALDDAWSALGQVQALCSQWGGDPGRMALCGESAGGNLALLLAQMAAANGMDAVRAVAVAYPITDAATRNRDSYRFFGTGYGLTRSILDLTRRAYLPDSALWRDPCVSPLYGTRSGLPPVLVVNAQFDPLASEGLAFVQAIIQAGGQAQRMEVPGVLHGFLTNDRFFEPEAEQVSAEMGRFLGGKLEEGLSARVR